MIHTKDRLAGELRQVGLVEMAAKAAGGYYDDFLSPLSFPCLQLVNDLEKAARGNPHAAGLARRAMDGEWDSTPEESEAWAKSPDGRDAFNRLVSGR